MLARGVSLDEDHENGETVKNREENYDETLC